MIGVERHKARILSALAARRSEPRLSEQWPGPAAVARLLAQMSKDHSMTVSSVMAIRSTEIPGAILTVVISSTPA
jgi:hypothetical protein